MVDFTTCVRHTLVFLRHVLSFFQLLGYQNSTGRLTPCAAAPRITRCADAKQRTNCAPTPHTVGARTAPTRAAPLRRAGMVPADTTDSVPIAGRPSSYSYSPTCTYSSLGRASQPQSQTPQHLPTPLVLPPPRPGAAGGGGTAVTGS